MKINMVLFFVFCFCYGQNKTIDGIVAIVEDNIILKSDLSQMISITAAQNKLNLNEPVVYKNLEEKIINSMIDQKVILEMALLDSVIVDESEVDQALEQQIENLIFESNGRENAEKLLGQSINSFRREFWYEMQNRLITERYQQTLLSDIKLTRQDVERFLETYKDSLPIVPTKVKLHHILIKVKPNKKSKQSTINKLKSLREKLVQKKVSFSEQAKLHSEDIGSKGRGGELGWVKRGSLVKNFENTAFTLKLNEISNPIETEFGFHILETLDKKGEKVKVRHILIKPPITELDTKNVYNFLDSLRVYEINNIVDFKSFSEKYNEDETTEKAKGSLGWIIPETFYIEEIGQAINYLEINKCSPPIHSSLGIHLLWIEDVQEGGFLNLKNHYSEVENLALNYKKGKWFNKWIQDAKSKFYIYKQVY